jgi:hypothetical protein
MDTRLILKTHTSTPELLELAQMGIHRAKNIIEDQPLMKDIIYSTFLSAVGGTNMAMKQGGWEGLVKENDMNENLKTLITNKSLYLYTQVLIALISEVLNERN